MSPEPGIYPDVPLSEYLSWDLPSKSWFRPASRSLARLKAYLEEREETEAMRFGSLVHTALLEPDKIETRYTVKPKFGRKKADLQAKSDWEAENAESEWVSQSEIQQARDAASALRADKIIGAIIGDASSVVELSFVWVEPHSGETVKGRLDLWCPGRGVILELKTCRDAREHAFASASEQLGYHFGAALYRNAMQDLLGLREPPLVLVIAVENDGYFEHIPYEFEPAWLTSATNEYQRLLLKIRDARKSNTWTRYEPKIIQLQRPMWAKKSPMPGNLDPEPF